MIKHLTKDLIEAVKNTDPISNDREDYTFCKIYHGECRICPVSKKNANIGNGCLDLRRGINPDNYQNIVAAIRKYKKKYLTQTQVNRIINKFLIQ